MLKELVNEKYHERSTQTPSDGLQLPPADTLARWQNLVRFCSGYSKERYFAGGEEMDVNELMMWLFGGGTIFVVIISIGISILCTILPIAGIVWFLYSRRQKANTIRQASQTWITTAGKVIKSRVEVSGGEVTSVYPRVIYEYEVRGRQYQNDQIRAGDKYWASGTSQEAYKTVDRYPEGQDVTVYYNPENPAEASLER